MEWLQFIVSKELVVLVVPSTCVFALLEKVIIILSIHHLVSATEKYAEDRGDFRKQTMKSSSMQILTYHPH